MSSKARLIYKSNNTCFQTFLPVYFYGMSDGRMIVFFTRFKTNDPRDTTQEWIVAQHLDFKYDYYADKITTMETQEVGIEEFMDFADNFEQRVRTLDWFGNFYSNNEAQFYFNTSKDLMLSSCKAAAIKVDEYLTAIEI